MTHIAKHIAETNSSYIREILSVVSKKEIISLAGGLPCPDTFPMSIIDEILPRLTHDRSLFQYAATNGLQPLLEHVRERYQILDTHQVLITSGSQQGIDLCARAFIMPGEKVVVEAPSYLGALQVFSLTQADVVTVTQEGDGPNLAELESHFAHRDIVLFYAVPDFHNPTGCCWSLKKRVEVARLCKQYDVLLIEDAPYREIRFSGIELPTVSSLCPDHSIILRSFSKLISPALRVAILTVPKRWYSQLTKLKQAMDLHTSPLTQKLTLDILQHADLDQHIDNVKRCYQERYQVLSQELSLLSQEDYQFSLVEGGMFVWLTVPICDTFALAQSALDKGVAVVPSSEFFINEESRVSALRLNFSHNKPDQIRKGIDRLKPILEDFR